MFVLALSLPASAQEMSSDRFVLRGGSLSTGGGAELESAAGDRAGLTIGPSSPVGISRGLLDCA